MNGDKGYLLEVDVRYPTEIHDSHDELPFLSERMEINGVTKPAQALEHGLILERIHRAIEFNQSAWMKPYIDFNTKLRFLLERNMDCLQQATSLICIK